MGFPVRTKSLRRFHCIPISRDGNSTAYAAAREEQADGGTQAP